ncbi:MAG: TIGR04211 family SH3 domain-containing protein [Desulfohalobiaceae bacterium]|nr:TIGR04211 family SH3 domain-containing protein [Desulfohalobiaceae bacterium]
MYSKSALVACLCLAIWLVAQPCVARTVHVTDELRITLRESPGQKKRILKTLPTGTSLEVLQERENWLRVETEKGREGWVLKRYTMERLPYKQTNERLKAKIADLEDKHNQAKEKIQRLEKAKNRLASQLESTNQTLRQVRQDYRTLQEEAPKLPEIKNSLAQTRDRLQASQTQVKELRQKLDSLRSRNSQFWFLAGAGVVFISCLIGFLLGRIRRRKSRSLYF